MKETKRIEGQMSVIIDNKESVFCMLCYINVYTDHGDIRHADLNILSMVDQDKMYMNIPTAITRHIHTKTRMH